MSIVTVYDNPGSLVLVDHFEIIYSVTSQGMTCWGECPDSEIVNMVATEEHLAVLTSSMFIVKKHTRTGILHSCPFRRDPDEDFSLCVCDGIIFFYDKKERKVSWCTDNGYGTVSFDYGYFSAGYYFLRKGLFSDVFSVHRTDKDHSSGIEITRPEGYYRFCENILLPTATRIDLSDHNMVAYYRGTSLLRYWGHYPNPEFSRWIVMGGQSDYWEVDQNRYLACHIDKVGLLDSRLEEMKILFDFSVRKIKDPERSFLVGTIQSLISEEDRKQIIIYQILSENIMTQDGHVWAADGIYRLTEHLERVELDHLRCFYPPFISCQTIERPLQMSVDIRDNPEGVLPQLVTILNSLYRLNPQILLDFDLLDREGNVRSYGSGATRHVCHLASQELEEILIRAHKGEFPKISAQDLGGCIYILNSIYGLKLRSLHPYFFVLLCRSDRGIDLMKKFKPELAPTYAEYSGDPKAIAELLDIPAPLRLVRNSVFLNLILLDHLLASDLTQPVKEFYQGLMRGFERYDSRRANKNVIACLSPIFYVKMLRDDTVNRSELIVIQGRIRQDPSSQLYLLTQEAIVSLSDDDYRRFRTNLTGCSWYEGPITIKYPVLESQIRFRVLDDELSAEEEDSENESEHENEEGENLNYRVETCATTLTIGIDPTLESVIRLVQAMVISDRTIVN